MAERKKSGSVKKLQPNQFGLLIDENLTPALVKHARALGFRAGHVNDAGLRTSEDKAVARYAVEQNLIVVTNDTVDFRRLYRRRRNHPGLIFITSVEHELLTRDNQLTLFNIALADLLEKDLLQEVLRVHLLEDDGDIEYEMQRFELPRWY